MKELCISKILQPELQHTTEFLENSGLRFIAAETCIRHELGALPGFLGEKDTKFLADAIKMPCSGTH
jgi:hypothetical protein